MLDNFKELYELSKNLSVLYIEDDINLISQTVDVLDDLFDIVSVSTNGIEGLDNYIEFKNDSGQYYDIIVTDLNMPKMDGLEMIKKMLDLNPDQVIVVISAHNESDKLLKLIDLGVPYFLLKPILPQKLIDTFLKICKNIYNQKEKEKYQIQQAKLISMGEMIDSIAHQWLQPISIMKLQAQTLQYENDLDELSKDDIDSFINKQMNQIEHITNTLSEFRGFFRPNKDLQITTYEKEINGALILLKDTITENTLDIKLDLDDTDLKLIPNEFKHVLINLVNNAIYVYNDKNIEYRDLSFKSFSNNEYAILEIQDSAGGIPKDIISKIFNLNFTTKGEKGSGVGLYLTTKIIEKIGGKLEVENKNNGAVFRVYLKRLEE